MKNIDHVKRKAALLCYSINIDIFLLQALRPYPTLPSSAPT